MTVNSIESLPKRELLGEKKQNKTKDQKTCKAEGALNSVPASASS